MSKTVSSKAWLGLLLLTESGAEQPEWRPIAWVVKNRIAHPQYPDTVEENVLRPRQFSYFNRFDRSLDPAAVYEAAVKEGYGGHGFDSALLGEAEKCADAVLRAPAWRAPFGSKVVHFWHPQSMVPSHTDPAWAGGLYKFQVPGLNRIKFAESE